MSRAVTSPTRTADAFFSRSRRCRTPTTSPTGPVPGVSSDLRRGGVTRRWAAGVLALLTTSLAIGLAGCGGDEASNVLDPGPIHVHGLGVDPDSSALYIATHAGLFRLGVDDETYARVGDTFEDLMGFAVAEPGRLLASGHPDAQQAVEQDLPPHLGLVESTDGGTTWTTLALQGEADFHLLRTGGGRVYGGDATTGRLVASSDGGRTWKELDLPRGLIDLAVSPAGADELLAATEGGTARSSDGGESWEDGPGSPGLLAWPAIDRLYGVGFDGTVRVSGDGGRSWTDAGSLDGEPVAVAAADADHLYVALHDATILESADGGASWSIRAEPPNS
jgi:photosystem II stability/assembly factor-like uncharacterized protein